MHDPEPEEPKRSRWRSGGAGAAGALAVLLAKFKSILALAAGAKYLWFLPKIALSAGSLVASIALYAALYGSLKLGIVLVLMILVHELGHFVTLRNMGVPVTLPYFIPGLGAFVAQKAQAPTAVHDAVASLMGPVVGLLAAAFCWWYALATAQPFWLAAAYIGFLLNAFNLIPFPPLDGWRVAGTIDPRLWIGGVVAFFVLIFALHLLGPATILILVLFGASAVTQAIAAWRGQVDPRVAAVPPRRRAALALAYFAVVAVAAGGAVATHPPVPR